MKIKSKYWILLILTIASFLRLWRLGDVPVSLFGDELDVGYHAFSILKTGRDYSGNLMPLNFHSLAEWRTPLYLYSTVPTVALFGISALGVRLPAALFGIMGIWAMYALTKEILTFTKTSSKKVEVISLISAFVMAVSPWHIQYSRAGFEVTMLLSFYLFGLYYFFKSIRKGANSKKITTKLDYKNLEDANEKAFGGQYLWIAVVHLVLTPLIYATAKLFTPFLIVFLAVVWRKEILSLSKKYIIWAVIAGVLVGIPTAYGSLSGGGTQRFGHISVFGDRALEQQVGADRLLDARQRSQDQATYDPSGIDRFWHNKIVFWAENVTENYLTPFSSEYLFIKGDPNLRHSIEGMGMFYKIEAVTLILGLIFFFTSKSDRKIKLLIGFWILGGIIPSTITQGGANHATRLILILPPLVFLISYGIYSFRQFPKRTASLLAACYLLLYIFNFASYQHNYWVHNPWESEGWWHAGHVEAIQSIKEIEGEYDEIYLSMAKEPIWIFFAAGSEYPPKKWQAGYPFSGTTTEGFGEHSYIGKYHFVQFNPENGSIYDLPRYIDGKTLYLAVATEIGANLIKNPEAKPAGLRLINTITLPSGEPAFYLLTSG